LANPVASRGPLPKRSGTHLGHRSRAQDAAVTKALLSGVTGPASVDRRWHPVAKRWYRAIQQSGQAQFFEPTDWALAWYVAHEMSRSLSGNVAFWSSNNVKNVMAAAEALLSTESSRRRARIEVERQPQGTGTTGGKPKELREYRTRLTPSAPAGGDKAGGTSTA
jgi:hypothetical protein